MKMLVRVALCLVTFSAFAQTPMRLSWQEFAKDPRRVQSFRNAVAMMKSRNTADRTSVEYRKSWEYWANMHGYFGTTAKSGTVAQWREANDLTDPSYDPYFEGVENTSPPDATAQAVWDQCQHRTDYFFGWHRLFLFYFETVLQEAAADRALRLPYWDYTDPANLSMPEEFRSPTYTDLDGRTLDNPLFEKRREPGWEDNTNQLSEDDTDIDLPLDYAYLLDTKDSSGQKVAGYQPTIEASPHGYTHCAVMGCRATVMGAVPYSSNDPIFWIHHCNIDRLWDCWLSISGHKNPDSIMAKEFSYVDASGTQVTKKISNLFDGSLIDYVYQQASNCARKPTTPVAAAPRFSEQTVARARAALKRPVLIGAAKDSTAINALVTAKRVTLPATASLSHPRQFALQEQSQLPVATELILRGIRFTRHPGASFRVFLQRADDPARRAFVGTISFFSEEAEGQGHHPQGEITRVFDATDELQELDFEGTGTFELDVVIEADDRRVGPRFNPAATGLTIDEISLSVKRDL